MSALSRPGRDACYKVVCASTDHLLYLEAALLRFFLAGHGQRLSRETDTRTAIWRMMNLDGEPALVLSAAAYDAALQAGVPLRLGCSVTATPWPEDLPVLLAFNSPLFRGAPDRAADTPTATPR